MSASVSAHWSQFNGCIAVQLRQTAQNRKVTEIEKHFKSPTHLQSSFHSHIRHITNKAIYLGVYKHKDEKCCTQFTLELWGETDCKTPLAQMIHPHCILCHNVSLLSNMVTWMRAQQGEKWKEKHKEWWWCKRQAAEVLLFFMCFYGLIGSRDDIRGR